MTYKSFTIQKSKKNPDNFKVDFTGERYDEMGKWETSATFGELVKCSEGYVLMKFVTKPAGVFMSIEHFMETIEKQFGIKPSIK